MSPELTQFLSTIAAAALGAFAAAALGYKYAIAKFRGERTFDRQLLWYEKAASGLLHAANKLNWAIAADAAQVTEAERSEAWAAAHDALIGLRGLEVEAEMYAAPDSYEALSSAVADVTSLTRTIWEMRSGNPRLLDSDDPTRLYEIVFKMLYHAASRMGSDVREHLGLEAIPREWRLYDRDFRNLQAELQTLRDKGLDFTYGASDPSPTSGSKQEA